jgi:Hemerythrin HHE cation binding domain
MPVQLATDAIAMLKEDHRRVEELFDKFEAASSGSKQKIAEQICDELKIHTTLEEEIFYPALRGKIEESTLNEAYVEHDGAKLLVNDILAGGPKDCFYEAKVKVLSEEIKHHVREEEQRGDGMFSQARAAGVDLVMLRDQMIARKKELMELARSENLPPAQMQAVGMLA